MNPKPVSKFDSLAKLDTAEQRQWLVQHIPHRVRAVLAGLPMPAPWAHAPVGWQCDAIAFRCFGNSMWEGRLTAMRWLILFVGIAHDDEWLPKRPTVYDEFKDVFINRFTDGVAVDLASDAAKTLARVCAGCSKATSHPTYRTNHPDVFEPQLAEALALAIPHLERLYEARGKRMVDLTLTAKSEEHLLSEWTGL